MYYYEFVKPRVNVHALAYTYGVGCACAAILGAWLYLQAAGGFRFVSFGLDFPVPAAGSGWVILTLPLCAVDPKQTSNQDSDPSYSIQFKFIRWLSYISAGLRCGLLEYELRLLNRNTE